MVHNGSLDFLDMIKNSREHSYMYNKKSSSGMSRNTNGITGASEDSDASGSNYTEMNSERKTVLTNAMATTNCIAAIDPGPNCIAVIDTETNWRDEVMSLGVALADASNYKCLEKRYYIFEPESFVGGMFSGVMELGGTDPIKCRRDEAMADLGQFLTDNKISKIFAYNARFDQGHLPELGAFEWYDIMRIAAYRQYNSAIPDDLPCCKTGRLKSNYGVEPIMKLLTGNCRYCEKHNAVYDAVDELKIVELLGLPLESYEVARL